MSNRQEHECFAKMIDGINRAASEAKVMAGLRNDRRWEMISELLKSVREKMYQTAEWSSRQ